MRPVSAKKSASVAHSAAISRISRQGPVKRAGQAGGANDPLPRPHTIQMDPLQCSDANNLRSRQNMTSKFKIDRSAALAALGLALLSTPALAVVNQSVEFLATQDIQSATLVIEESGDMYPPEIREDGDSNKVVFLLPDELVGKQATVYAVLDGKSRSLQVTVGQGPILFQNFQNIDRDPNSAAFNGGWFFGIGASVGTLSSDFAARLAQQSALDAEELLAGQGITNINSAVSADDDAFAWDGSIRAGYWFADDGRLSLDFRTGSVDDFALDASVGGDIPQSASVATAQSVATAGLDIWSANVTYERFFTQTSNFGFAILGGVQSVERTSSFVSTLAVDGMPIDSFTGAEALDENVLQYGLGIEWTNRRARGNWVPTVGVRILQTNDIDILDQERLQQCQLYFNLDYIARRN